MAGIPPTPALGVSVLDLQRHLEEIDTKLYRLQHVLGLLGDFAGQHSPGQFTDGLKLEMFAVVFDSFSDELREVRGDLEDIQRGLPR